MGMPSHCDLIAEDNMVPFFGHKLHSSQVSRPGTLWKAQKEDNMNVRRHHTHLKRYLQKRKNRDACQTTHLVSSHLLYEFFQIQTGFGVASEAGADGRHDVFQSEQYGPLPVLVFGEEHLEPFPFPVE